MDLGDYNHRFGIFDKGREWAHKPAEATLTAEIARDLLASDDTPRAVLVSALTECLRRLESVLSCVSGTSYRCQAGWPRVTEFTSPGIEAITGHDGSFFALGDYDRIIVLEDLPLVREALVRAVAEGTSFAATYRIRHKSGDTRWVSERGVAVRGADGCPHFFEGVISDVTQIKALELGAEAERRKVERGNARRSRILESTPDCVVSVDRNWKYTYFNKWSLKETDANDFVLPAESLDTVPNIKTSPFWPALCTAMHDREPAHAQGFIPEVGKWYDLTAVPDEEGITVFYRDVSRYKELERSLESRAEDLKNTLDSIPHIVWSTLADGTPDYFNKVWDDYVGEAGDYPNSDVLLGGGLFYPGDRKAIERNWAKAVAEGEPFEQEFRLRHHSGEYRWLIGRASPQRDAEGKIVRWFGASTEIHKRVLAEQNLRESQILQANILDASVDCIKILNVDGVLLQISAPGLAALEVEDSAQVIGSRWVDFWPERGRVAARRAIRKARNGKAARFTGFCPTAKGTPRWWDNVLTPIRDDAGQIQQILCVSRNITEQRRAADRLRAVSEQDALTSLPNRRAFEAHLKKAADRARASRTNVGLMLLDLDHFKHVNDTLGHLAGDHLLRVLARRLKTSVSDAGFVARLGGDEFAVVLEGITEENELVRAATQVHARLEASVSYAGQPMNGGLSIGCAMFPRDAANAHDLFKHADTALYDLKMGGRGGIQMFSGRMLEAAERTASQLTLARRVIHDDAVEPYYQPKVRLDTEEIVGFEALLRWWCPGNGIQPPSSVAEAFNDYELAAKIGGQMQQRILTDISRWRAAGLKPLPVSINAAPAEFLRDDFAERLLERLVEHDIPPSLVEVEITEHAFLERRTEHVVRALGLLKQSGIRIALDDFGTGHSSLSHLRDFPVDVLKLDRSFIARMLDEPGIMMIVRAIAELGHGLSLDSVAEGIETTAQLQALRDSHCRFGQGYLFGKAMDFRAVAQRLA